MAQVAKSNEAEKATDNLAAISSWTAEKATDNLAAISSRTGNGVAAIADRTGDDVAAIGRRAADKGADAAREATERTRDAARRGFQAAQRTTAGATEVGQAFAELVKEQARDNAEAFRALAGAFDWGKAARIQADLLRASFARSAEFTRGYFEVVRAVMTSAASATREQARKAG
jgi:hypothetical protein